MFDVANINKPERRLDNIWIENRKIHLNRLRYCRYGDSTRDSWRMAQNGKRQQEGYKFGRESKGKYVCARCNTMFVYG